MEIFTITPTEVGYSITLKGEHEVVKHLTATLLEGDDHLGNLALKHPVPEVEEGAEDVMEKLSLQMMLTELNTDLEVEASIQNVAGQSFLAKLHQDNQVELDPKEMAQVANWLMALRMRIILAVANSGNPNAVKQVDDMLTILGSMANQLSAVNTGLDIAALAEFFRPHLTPEGGQA